MSAIDDFPHLPPAAHLLACYAMRTQTVAIVAVCVLTMLGAACLGLLLANSGTGSLLAMAKAICGPNAILSSNFITTASLSAGIWAAMALVMMLPGAAPMLVTYAEIADTAAAKGIATVSPLVLATGYLTIWLVFAVTMGFTETVFAGILATSGASIAAPLAGISLLFAGLYQFSVLKHACLSRCRRPFAFFFANWTDRASSVFRLGLRQGFYCLGCCWALMFTMFAVGSMNLVWMTVLAVIMALEKTTMTENLPRMVGGALVLAGGYVLISDFGLRFG